MDVLTIILIGVVVAGIFAWIWVLRGRHRR
jgi:hypothetical protein